MPDFILPSSFSATILGAGGRRVSRARRSGGDECISELEGANMYWNLSRLGLLVFAWAVLGAWSVPGDVFADDKDEQEKEVTLREVPKKVKATILKAAGKNEIKELEEVVLKLYEAEWMRGNKEVEVFVTPKGRLLMKKVEKKDADDDDEDEDEKDEKDEDDEGEVKERKISIDKVPDKAKAAIMKLAKKNKILEVEEVYLKFYEAEWMQGQQEVEILVTYDGKLVKPKKGKAKGDDDDDDDDDDDKDDDN
jgi:hypothetical protein